MGIIGIVWRAIASLTRPICGIAQSLAGTMFKRNTTRPCEIRVCEVSGIISGPREEGLGERETKRVRISASSTVHATQNHEVGKTGRCQIDTLADTSCAGSNMRAIRTTGQYCNVKPFHDNLGTIEKVPIASCITAWDHPSNGKTYILVFHECLHFGPSLDGSLINPNQVRDFGIELHDNAFDEGRPFGIQTEGITIPFRSQGATIFVQTRVPTDEEVTNCTGIQLTSERPWDPQNVKLPDRLDTWPEVHEEEFNATDGDRASFISAVESNRQACIDRDDLTYETDLVLSSVGECYVEQTLTENLVKSVRVSGVGSATRHTPHSVIDIARKFGVSLKKAAEIAVRTDQRGIRQGQRPLVKRMKALTHIDKRELSDKWHMDFVHANVKSIEQSVGLFIITNGSFVDVWPSPAETNVHAGEALNDMCYTVGIPKELKTDQHGCFKMDQGGFKAAVRKNQIHHKYTQKEREGQLYRGDIMITKLKQMWQQMKVEKGVPNRAWSFAVRHIAKLLQHIPAKQGQPTGREMVTGFTPDISDLLDFEFWDLVWFYPHKHPSITDDARQLGRWMGSARNVGTSLTYWIMPVSGKPLTDDSVEHVTAEDLRNDAIKAQVAAFDAALTTRLNDANFTIPGPYDGRHGSLDDFDTGDTPVDSTHGDGTTTRSAYGDDETTPRAEEYGNQPGLADVDDVEGADLYLNAKVRMEDTQEGKVNLATVVGRNRDSMTGTAKGEAHENPLLDTREYLLELSDGTTEVYLANQIAENLWAQCDTEGREFMVVDAIVGHKFGPDAMRKDKASGAANGPKPKTTKTTKGVEIQVEFSSGDTVWLPLVDVKDSNPIELAEYAVAQGIQDEPAFHWWVDFVLKRRNRRINQVKKKYWKTTHKYGVRLPKSVEEAIRLDKENGDTQWQDAIKKEMSKANVAYVPVEGVTAEGARRSEGELIGFQEIKCHLIFDVKMDFTRKARFVAGGHTTETPASLTYSSVVSRESVRIAFFLGALNGLDVLSCDIGNAYLNAKCREKIWFKAGPECGENAGKVCKLVRALYGLRSSGAAWRDMFSNFIKEVLDFTPTTMDPDVYIRKSFKTGSGEAYYEYLLVYVDDILVFSEKPSAIMEKIGVHFTLKDGFGEPDTFLGAGLTKKSFPTEGGTTSLWTMDSAKYVANAVKTVESLLAEDGRELKGKSFKTKQHSSPLDVDYKPELESTPICDDELASRYRQLIGILRWAVELGRLDILHEVSLLSQYQAGPRTGHLEAAYCIFYYLKHNPVRRVVFDSARIEQTGKFNDGADWKAFYGDIEEEAPLNAPEPLGEAVKLTCFVDANHAGNVVTRRSHTGVIILLGITPIVAFSKRQNTVETATFGSEFVAMRIARDLIMGLRLKLMSFGVKLDGPADVHCDNLGVCKNTMTPESTLSKKHNAINYHAVREAVARGLMRVCKEDTKTNIADALTKLMSYAQKDQLLCDYLGLMRN